MNWVFILLLCVFLTACSKKDEIADIQHDTLLQAPAAPDTAAHSATFENGLLIDSSRILPADRERALARLTPKQILAIYQDYQPLRRKDVTTSVVDSFLKAENVSLSELRAVLAEGDRLRWSATAK